MRKIRLLTILLVLTLTSALGAAGVSYAQSTPVAVRVQPSTVQVGVGQTVDLAIEVVSVQAMYAFDVDLRFDPAVVEVVDAVPNQSGVQASLGAFLDPGFAILNQADNSQGSLRFAMTQINPSEAKSGSGNLIVVKFKGKQVNGTTAITFNDVQLAQRDGTKIPNSPAAGQIQVVQSVSGPTNTNVPTQGAGTPMPTETTGLPTVSKTATQSIPATSFSGGSNPTSSGQSSSGSSGVSNPTAAGVSFPTATSHASTATRAALVVPSATGEDLIKPTLTEPVQPPTIAQTTTVGETPTVETELESPEPSATGEPTTSPLPAVTVIVQTQNSPTHSTAGKWLAAIPLVGAVVFVGLGGILVGFVVAVFLNKRR
jgi:hypothetical protein